MVYDEISETAVKKGLVKANKLLQPIEDPRPPEKPVAWSAPWNEEDFMVCDPDICQ